MPRIPTADKFTPGRQSVGVRVNQNLGGDQYQALQRVGGATREVSKFLFDYGMRLQDHINKGDLADAEVGLDETQQRVEDALAQEQDQSKWEGISQKIWDDHRKSLDGKTYAPVVKKQVDNMFTEFSGKSMVKVGGMKVQRDIQTANANLIRKATKQSRNGDIDGAVETLGGLNMKDPVAKANLIERTLSEGAYQDVFQQIQVNYNDEESLDTILEGLQSKDKEGNYTGHEGLGYDARKTLENQILTRKRAIKRTQTVTANKLARDVAKGDASLEDINSADIPEGEKEVLRTQVDFSAKIEQETSGAYKIIANRMKANWAQWLLGMERQPDEDEYASILKDISTVKLTKESKRKLFDMYLELKANDLSDNQEEGTHWARDRDVSQPEVDLRTEMGEIYKESFNTLGVDALSGAMWDQEKQIRDYFDRNPEATGEDIKAFKEMLILQIADDVATAEMGASVNEEDL
jgi:hypothetical protein